MPRSGRPIGVIGLHEALHLVGIAGGGPATSYENCSAWQPEVQVARAEGTSVDVSVAAACKF